MSEIDQLVSSMRDLEKVVSGLSNELAITNTELKTWISLLSERGCAVGDRERAEITKRHDQSIEKLYKNMRDSINKVTAESKKDYEASKKEMETTLKWVKGIGIAGVSLGSIAGWLANKFTG